jgi:hypothetical protein
VIYLQNGVNPDREPSLGLIITEGFSTTSLKI